MNDEIQSYVFLELIKFVIIVFVILRISNALNTVIFVIMLLQVFFRQLDKPMIFRLNLYITIKLITFIQRNGVTQVSVETISFIKSVTCDDIGTLANSLTNNTPIALGLSDLSKIHKGHIQRQQLLEIMAHEITSNEYKRFIHIQNIKRDT